jgi:hypothetical protein
MIHVPMPETAHNVHGQHRRCVCGFLLQQRRNTVTRSRYGWCQRCRAASMCMCPARVAPLARLQRLIDDLRTRRYF